MSQKTKAGLLRNLHSGPDILVLPNAWDAASARVVASEGFPAVATTSSGCAAVFGYPDGEQIPRSEMVFLVAKIAKAVDVPVTADMESGYGDPVQTALDVIAAGAVGLNIEDSKEDEFIPVSDQVERIRAIRKTADASGVALVINARTDIFLRKHGDEATRFERAVERLNAYRDAGADSLFAPGVIDAEMIGRLAKAVDGPLNILSMQGAPSLAQLQALGVRRVSFGGGPFRAALAAFRQFAKELHLRDTVAN